ncbi:MAG: C69 family dipeptidase, partial [Ignavibacteriales bacterium]|nr:C69 family dipeptidase [Ignavibacteriales bacterium]
MKIKIFVITNFLSFFLFNHFVFSQNKIQTDNSDYEIDELYSCTTITLGKDATYDGSVITSHTCDSRRTEGAFNIMPSEFHNEDEFATMTKRTNNNNTAMTSYDFLPIGEIPQVKFTYGYINTPYPCMNDRQLAIGESTFGGRSKLKSSKGLIDCTQLVRLMMERTTTARDAIKLAGELTKKYGYIDSGECLTIADKNEVWHLEILGPGKGNTGSIWVAQRVPDGHISVNANLSRIRKIDLSNPDYFMASENVFQVAQDSGWWNPNESEFEFCYAYADRNSIACRRREWRVFDLVAPSLKLNAESENYPFSVKPDTLVTLEKLISIFQDYYEGTDYDMCKNLTVTDDSGKTVISSMASPFMTYDERKLHRINGGWGWRGERTIAVPFTMYATITQSRNWLPDEVGGVVWFAFDNVATSIYIPLYCSITDIAESYKTS